MSLTEIVLALMLTSVVVGTTLQLVDPVRDVLGVQTHTSELHQRVRTGFERFHRDLVNAGLAVSNPGAGHYPLVAVVPGRIGGRPLNGRGNASSADDALTLLSTDVGAADVSTVSSLQNANTSVQITCVMSAAACGLRPDTTILIADTLGRSGLLRVTRVTGSVLTVVPLAGRQFSYGPGASIRPVSVRSYYHDEGRIQVRVEDGWRTDSPFLDGVVGLSFRYFGAPNSLAAGAGCAGGPFLSNTTMTSRQVELRPEALNDGPWCDGPIPYDVDVLRVQRIRVEIRFQTSDPAYRGTDPRLFARAGTAVRGRRAVPDATGSFDVTLRNKWWGSAQ